MLSKHRSLRLHMHHARQRGVVLIIALIVLVGMTLAAIALVRSVDTSNLIAGNLAFQQAAVHSGDTGIEAAIKWLEGAKADGLLTGNDDTNGYAADGAKYAPNAGESWNDYWTRILSAREVKLNGGDADSAFNKVSYVIDRMCNGTGASTSSAACVESPVMSVASGNSEEAGEIQLQASAVQYYRITVRIAGSRNTVSIVQAMVAM